mmetsp:Transcript_2968/g.14001  ORF Transcript_2968/g.14001 Transcript_2968/m.14001 type:complete len:196 (-) Transcript_2968:4302-4889(-)
MNSWNNNRKKGPRCLRKSEKLPLTLAASSILPQIVPGHWVVGKAAKMPPPELPAMSSHTLVLKLELDRLGAKAEQEEFVYLYKLPTTTGSTIVQLLFSAFENNTRDLRCPVKATVVGIQSLCRIRSAPPSKPNNGASFLPSKDKRQELRKIYYIEQSYKRSSPRDETQHFLVLRHIRPGAKKAVYSTPSILSSTS